MAALGGRGVRWRVAVAAVAAVCWAAAGDAAQAPCQRLVEPTTCTVFDLSALSPGPFVVYDAYPMKYVVAAPCHNVSAIQTNCSTFNGGDSGGAPAYAVSGECYALGHLSQGPRLQPLDASNASAGLALNYGGGVGGRAVTYQFVCDPGASAGAGPTHAVGGVAGGLGAPEATYEIVWPTPLACHPTKLAPPQCVQAPIPQPTPDQLAFQEMETGALISFNMATANGSQGCGAHILPDRDVYLDAAPELANTDQWCEAIAAFGGKYATLVAKHVCGFAIWPTNASLPGRNFTYTYAVPPGRDIVQALAESCRSVGVQLGLYYSVVSNEYLNVQGGLVRPASTLAKGQAKITQAEYVEIVVQQLTELWTNYGELTEIWFDGGFSVPGLEERLLALLNTTQRHAAIFNGCGLSPNAIDWIGTESGHAPYPVWNTQTGCASGAGSSSGNAYVPKEADVTLQNTDTWFYKEGMGYRSFADLVSIYHDSVGHGANMLLNVAPPINTTLPEVAMDTYRHLGAFVRACYGAGSETSPTALAASGPCSACMALNLTLPRATAMDRFLVKEELNQGQRVLAFTIAVDGQVVFNGSAVGRTLIARLPANVTGTSVRLEVSAVRGGAPSFRLFAVPDPASCTVAAPKAECTLLNNTKYLGHAISHRTLWSVADCCAACRALPECAFFTATPVNTQQVDCALLNAMTGSDKAPGVVSGAPRR